MLLDDEGERKVKCLFVNKITERILAIIDNGTSNIKTLRVCLPCVAIEIMMTKMTHKVGSIKVDYSVEKSAA